MDKIDLQILLKLFENSRITYRELADLLDMSVSAVHKRVNSLMDDGIITAFVARPSLHALKYLYLFVEGVSSAKSSLNALSDELGQHENVNSVGYASGKWMYVLGYLRDITELQEVSIFVTKTSQIKDPLIGIVNFPYMTTPEPLTSVDYKIIKSLQRDSRKPVVDISDETGLSAKTVKKRIDRMVDNQLIRLTLEWNPFFENSLVTVFTLYLNEEMDLRETILGLYARYKENIVVSLSFSNIPNVITLEILTKSAHESQKIQKELESEGFKDVIPRILIFGKYYDHWIDQLVKSK